MPRGPFTPTTILIRDHLLEKGEDNPYSIYKTIKTQVHDLSIKRGRMLRPPTYDSIRVAIYLLKRLGLVTPTRRGQATRGKEIQLYRITTGKERALGWENPREAFYAPKTFAGRAFRGVLSGAR